MLDPKAVALAQDDSQWVWHAGDQALYRLCEVHPDHSSVQGTVAKLWLIGRSYAAALERSRAPGSKTGAALYEVAASSLRESSLDTYVATLRAIRSLDANNVPLLLKTHAHLVGLLKPHTGDDKRSLASKYLHFHAPEAVPIYDAVSERACRTLLGPWRPERATPSASCDPQYRLHVLRILELRSRLEGAHNVLLTPRQMDRVLWFAG